MIDHGKVIAEGTPGQLKASVGSGALHVRLLDPEQRARGRAGPRPRARARSTSSPTRRRCRRRAPTPTAAAEAVAELARAGIGIADFSLGQPSLDEVFLALTGHPAEEPGATRRIAIEEEQAA